MAAVGGTSNSVSFNPTYRLLVAVAKLLGISFIASRVLVLYYKDSLPPIASRFAFPLCLILSATGSFAYQAFIYPRYVDPLRHLPTVKADSRAPMLMEQPKGKSTLEWMKTHPDAEIIRVKGPGFSTLLIPSGANALRDILSTHSYNFEKPWGARAMLARILGWGLILTEGHVHKMQRKLLQPSFNIRKIRQLYDLMWEKTGILQHELEKDIARSLDGEGFGKVEMTEWASRLTLDIIGPTAMGRDFHSLTHENNEVATAFLRILEPGRDRLIYFALHFFVPEWILRTVPSSVNTILQTECGFLHNTCSQIVHEKKRELLKNEKLSDYDILSSIIQTGLPEEEVIAQMMTFLAAGHETTASALTWVCYMLARYPEVQERLRAEVRRTIPSADSPINYQLIEDMTYLHGICEETQRLYPTVPLTVRQAMGDTTVAGYDIRKGSMFVLAPYAVNRNPHFWGENASEFVPERWIDEHADGTLHPNKTGGTDTNYADMTFLHGPRACIGRDFAKAELRCAVAGVVGRFEMKLQNPGEEPKSTGVVTTKPEGGMHLLMKPLSGW